MAPPSCGSSTAATTSPTAAGRGSTSRSSSRVPTEDLTEYGAPPPAQVIAHTNLYWKFHAAPGRTAGVTDTAEVSFGGIT